MRHFPAIPHAPPLRKREKPMEINLSNCAQSCAGDPSINSGQAGYFTNDVCPPSPRLRRDIRSCNAKIPQSGIFANRLLMRGGREIERRESLPPTGGQQLAL